MIGLLLSGGKMEDDGYNDAPIYKGSEPPAFFMGDLCELFICIYLKSFF